MKSVIDATREPASGHTYYPALDGFRGVAVLIVLLAHAGVPYLKSGGVGVDLFFVLSGFLITSILAGEFERTGNISRFRFYARRFLRLTPCLLVAVALFAVLFFLQYGDVPGKIIALSLTYTSNWARAIYDYSLLSMDHTWSLAIEEQYYLVWPLVIILLERKIKSNAVKFRILLLVALAFAIYRALMVSVSTPQRICFGLDTHCDGLILGSALAYLVLAQRENSAGSEFRHSLISNFAVPAALTSLGLVLLTLTWKDVWMGRLGFAAVAVAAAVIIWDLVCSSKSWLKPILTVGVLVYLGKISYGLYLLHYPIFHYIDFALPRVPWAAGFCLKILLSLLAASLSFHLIELRFLRFKSRF